MEFRTKRDYFHYLAEQQLQYNAEADAVLLYEECLRACEESANLGEFQAECPESVKSLFNKLDRKSRMILKLLKEKLNAEELDIEEKKYERFFAPHYIIAF